MDDYIKTGRGVFTYINYRAYDDYGSPPTLQPKLVKPAIELIKTYNPIYSDILVQVGCYANVFPYSPWRTTFAVYNPLEKFVSVNPNFKYSPKELAWILVHEAQHALDDANGKLSYAPNMEDELSAYTTGAGFWGQIWGSARPSFPAGQFISEQAESLYVAWKNDKLCDSIKRNLFGLPKTHQEAEKLISMDLVKSSNSLFRREFGISLLG